MLRAKTVLVVGAGASCEAKFPDGKKLLTDISTKLDFRYKYNQLQSGDVGLADVFLEMVGRRYGDAFNAWLYASHRIRDAAIVSLSIDNVIEQHQDDEKVGLVGKLAIAQSILQAEAKSLLKINRDDPQATPIGPLRDTWYVRILQMLTEGVPRTEAGSLFGNLKIICFNYDRAIEHFLPIGISAAWGFQKEEAEAIAAQVTILHPYGTVGKLPYLIKEKPHDAVEFGTLPLQRLIQLASDIRTFSERVEDEAALDGIRTTMAEAEQVIFLGFAFHRQNMEIIRPQSPKAVRALATVMGLPENERRQIEKQIRGMFRLREGADGLVLHDGDCASLFSDNWRTVTDDTTQASQAFIV